MKPKLYSQWVGKSQALHSFKEGQEEDGIPNMAIWSPPQEQWSHLQFGAYWYESIEKGLPWDPVNMA